MTTDDLSRAEELATFLDEMGHGCFDTPARERWYQRAALLRHLVARCREAEAVILRAGIIRGKDAAKIRHEMEHGTPDTPERIATLRRADEVYREVGARSALFTPKEAPDAT